MIKNKPQVIDDIFIVRKLLEKYGNEHVFKEYQLTASLYTVLMAIAEGCTNIHKAINEAPASTSQKIQKLEELDLLERSINMEDKRRWNFALSRKGEKIIKSIDEKRKNSILLNVFNGITSNEVETFHKVLKNMKELLNNNLKK